MTGELNFAWAREIVGALVRGGVTEVEIAPGSRSAPLVLAVRSFPGVRARVHVDERCAAFFALGYGRRSGRPAAVVATSGTAVANLLPAVVEADASDVPLIVLSADRPPRLRGADANQTIDQVGIFGARLRFEADLPVPDPEGLPTARRLASEAAASAVGSAEGAGLGPAGPVHLNVPFEKPLEPSTPERLEQLRAEASEPKPEGAAKQSHDPEDGPAEQGAALPARDPDGTRGSGGPFLPAEQGAALLARDPDGTRGSGGPFLPAEQGAALLARELAAARRPVLVAGPSSSPDAEGALLAEIAGRLRIPLLADPLSGARFAAGARPTVPTAAQAPVARGGPSPLPPPCGAYDHYLRDPAVVDALAPDLIVRTGRTPTSAALEAALERWRDAVQIVVDAGRQPKDHQRLADHYVRAPAGPLMAGVARTAQAARAEAPKPISLEPDLVASAGAGAAWPVPDDHWRALWSQAESAAWSAVEDACDDPGNEGAYAAAVLRALPPGATLFVSSSMPVRDVDGYGRPASLGVRVLANRGASGIDGIVSSALGCAAGGGPVVGVLGDLAFYHDMNGLLAARDPQLNVVLVLVDNDGGGIFHMLPIRKFEPAFTPYFATPHGLDFRHAARLYDIPFRDARGPEELAEAVAAGVRRPGTEIVRVRTDRETNRRRHAEVRAEAARRAVAALGLAASGPTGQQPTTANRPTNPRSP